MTNKTQVLHLDGTLEPFKPRIIKDKLLTIGLPEEEAEKVKIRVAKKINGLDVDVVSTSTISSEVSAQLTSRGFLDIEKDNRILGARFDEIDKMINSHIKDNANMGDNTETLYKYIAELVLKPYTLQRLPDYIAEAHINGLIHIHDMADFFLKPNCLGYDIQTLLKRGLSCDGDVGRTSRAGPAQHFEVFIQHMLQTLMSGKVDLSGGQAFHLFNIYLAPLTVDLTYEELKQSLQTFIFGCNMSCVSKGEVVFSSIGLHPACPDYLYNEPAMTYNGEFKGVYGDYEKESKRIFKIICELLEEGDSENRPFRFPNTICHLRDEYMDRIDDELFYFCKYLRRYPTGYFVNDDMENGGGIRAVMGALSSDTPVMTDKGFKYPQSLSIGDNVMTYSSDGTKQWNKIYNIIPKIAPDKVFQITLDNNYQFKVTNNHKLPTNNGIIKSEDLKVGMELYNYIDEQYIPFDDPEYEFIGVFLADGYIRDENRIKGRSNYFIEFHVKQEWKRDKIIDLCKLNKYNYEIQERKDETYTIKVFEKEVRDKLNQCYDDTGIKHFPSWVWDDKNKVSNIIKGLMFDGRKGSKTRWDWSCSDLPLVIDVLYALSYIGRQSTIYVDNRKGDSGNWRTNYRVSFGLNYKPKNKTKIKSIELVDNKEMVYDLSIENNHNYVCGLGGIHSENCRTASNDLDERFTWKENILNTGNLAFHTINLPLVALQSENLDDFYKRFDDLLEIVVDSLILRRNVVQKRLEDGRLPFLMWGQKDLGEPLYNIDTTTLSIGYCGLNECILELTDGKEDISTDLGVEMGEKIIQKIVDKCHEAKKATGFKFGCFSTPAESTAHRFATINKEQYPNAYVNGTKGHYYLTNSHHINPGRDVDILKHIKNADKFHKLANFGSILHIFISEVPDVDTFINLTKKIKEYNVGFWSYTLDFSICEDCGATILKAVGECPHCGSHNILTYSKITGYYTPIKNWNNGKLGEFKDRKRYIL